MAHNIFWGMVVILQLVGVAIALSTEPAKAILPIVLASLSSLACVGLFLRKPIFKLNFWAGAFGVCALYAIVIAFSLIVMLLGALASVGYGVDKLFVLGIVAATIQLLGIFGMFIYVFRSPWIWVVKDSKNPDEA